MGVLTTLSMIPISHCSIAPGKVMAKSWPTLAFLKSSSLLT